ncbi:hypothetical protein NEOLEDRAFT_353972 [Neolentinus lepideus HHB14362 ss-1]|uniref:Uncharacterized protein n=1 Tax=Neolentinus lepideus HHB14362 ss-1 TaxID=1314782 RepID=A0A165SKC5_9AGAM|nr:hypothetical protein NEOLEDRAFT_353972 [Neolentinus lepideus HHB14362 ss-1]
MDILRPKSSPAYPLDLQKSKRRDKPVFSATHASDRRTLRSYSLEGDRLLCKWAHVPRTRQDDVHAEQQIYPASSDHGSGGIHLGLKKSDLQSPCSREAHRQRESAPVVKSAVGYLRRLSQIRVLVSGGRGVRRRRSLIFSPDGTKLVSGSQAHMGRDVGS